jgi:hypothetical protein
MTLVVASYLTDIATKRAGVIPYTYMDGQLCFLLAYHADSGELSDFGGGVKKGENSLIAAYREFSEESRDSITCSVNDLMPHISVIHRDTSEIFFPVNKNHIKAIHAKFHSTETLKKCCKEITNIIVVPHNSLMSCYFNDYKIWKKISDAINEAVKAGLLPMLERMYTFMY